MKHKNTAYQSINGNILSITDFLIKCKIEAICPSQYCQLIFQLYKKLILKEVFSFFLKMVVLKIFPSVQYPARI